MKQGRSDMPLLVSVLVLLSLSIGILHGQKIKKMCVSYIIGQDSDALVYAENECAPAHQVRKNTKS